MRFLLTSAGIANTSIHDTLVDLLGKPVAESRALFIPTGVYPFPGGAEMAWKAISGEAPSPLCDLGWKSLGVLELTALPTSSARAGFPCSARPTPCWSGAAMSCTCVIGCRQSGLADLLPSLSESVYVGVSAGSIVVTPYNCDAEFNLQFVPRAVTWPRRRATEAGAGRFRVARAPG